MMNTLMNLILRLIGKFKPRKQVHYVNGSETLPEPLTREEEAVVLAKYHGGDESARQTLIEKNLRLVVFISKKFESSGINIEDLISIGTMGLIKGVQTFKCDKNIKLATYAARCIENEILMYLRKTARMKHEVSFDEPLNVDWDGNELLLSDVLGTNDNIVSQEIEEDAERQIVFESIRRLKAREKEIMFMRFGLSGGEALTQKEVADKLQISQSYISRLEKKIIAKIKKDVARQS
jgi:RNA polymerase sporulation-specific sigma factor